MPVNSRDQIKYSTIVNDINEINTSLNGSGEPLSFLGSPNTLRKIYSEIYGLRKILGEPNRRKNCQKFNGNDILLTGTFSTSGITITGSGTQFLSELSQGDLIRSHIGEYREIANVISDTSAELYESFSVNVPAGTQLYRLQFLSERLEEFQNSNVSLGYCNPIISVYQSFPKILRLERNSIVKVNKKMIVTDSLLTIDFNLTTNVFSSDGVTPIASNSETQNKHLYVLLTDSGQLQAMIIPDSEMAGSSHSYVSNPKLLIDYYSNTPQIFSIQKNGYYKNNKRVIATIRLNSSNEIEFFYCLGNGHRFKDVENIPIGNIFTETRWKREHPSCYIPDGSTVTNMSTEAPVLFRILSTNILPNWNDRFGRNIITSSGRNIRDTQEDAFQGHYHSIVHNPLINHNYGVQVWGYGNYGSHYLQGAGNSINNFVTNAVNDGVNGVPRIANETRPKNFALMYQIVRG
jgi:hypothetical protein